MNATAWAWHLPECWAWRWADVARGCICRPPACVEPLRPTPDEVARAKTVALAASRAAI